MVLVVKQQEMFPRRERFYVAWTFVFSGPELRLSY